MTIYAQTMPMIEPIITSSVLNNKEIIQAHNPRMFVKTYKLMFSNKWSLRKIGDRRVIVHRKGKILQSPQVGGSLLTLMDKLGLTAYKLYCNFRSSVFVDKYCIT